MSISEQTPRTVLKPFTEEERRKFIAVLDSFVNVDEEEAREQHESFEMLKNALDEDRLSYRKLFP